MDSATYEKPEPESDLPGVPAPEDHDGKHDPPGSLGPQGPAVWLVRPWLL